MPDKTLRIMIADAEHFHRMKLERLFNQQGYFRIAPVSDMQELLTLVEYGSEPFDLIVVNACLANGTLDLSGFLLDNSQVRHGFIYNAQEAGVSSVSVAHRSKVELNPIYLPDLASLLPLMARVDPEVAEPTQGWNRSIRQSQRG